MLVSISRIEHAIEFRPFLHWALVAIGEIRSCPERGEESLQTIISRSEEHSVSASPDEDVSTLEAKLFREPDRLTAAIHEKTCLLQAPGRVVGFPRFRFRASGAHDLAHEDGIYQNISPWLGWVKRRRWRFRIVNPSVALRITQTQHE